MKLVISCSSSLCFSTEDTLFIKNPKPSVLSVHKALYHVILTLACINTRKQCNHVAGITLWIWNIMCCRDCGYAEGGFFFFFPPPCHVISDLSLKSAAPSKKISLEGH